MTHFVYTNENSVADRMTELFQSTEGMCLVWCSSQNIDRIALVYEATKNSGRQLILDVYTAEIMRVTGDKTLPLPEHDDVKVYLPMSQKRRIVREEAFDIAKPYYPHRIYPEDLAAAASESVMIFRPSMLRELQKAECLKSALLVTSLWSGTVKKKMACIQAMQGAGLAYQHVHTSGHATEEELQQFVNAFPNSRIVPIHLEEREGFGRLSENVVFRNDHEWWEV